MKGRVLIIAGSDCSGGAGIQADIKSVAALGGYAMTAITALTVQDTRTVHDVLPVPPAMVAAQIRACLDDIGADAIKTGMLHDAALIEAVAAAITPAAKNIPLVLDPVMIAKSGAALLKEEALHALRTCLLPLAHVITPNIPEAETLLGHKIDNKDAMKAALPALGRCGAHAVLLKGGHMPGDIITDMLWKDGGITEWSSPRIDTRHTHGTGCTLASAIAALLAAGTPLQEAVDKARAYVHGAILHAPGLGLGHGPLNHGWNRE